MLQLTNRGETKVHTTPFGGQELAGVLRERTGRLPPLDLLTEPSTASRVELPVLTAPHHGLELSQQMPTWNDIPDSLLSPIVPRMSNATTSTTTSLTSIGQVLSRKHRDERLRRMSPERRALYHDIRTLREKIGPINFDVVETLREFRKNG